MNIFDHYRQRYEAAKDEEFTLQEFLTICRQDRSAYANAAERLLFRQFIMNHRHLAECQSCRIINGNRKLCRLSGRIHCRYHGCRLAVYNGA